MKKPWLALLLALTPSQYDSGDAGPVLQTARTNLAQARDDLKAALADAEAARNALKQLRSLLKYGFCPPEGRVLFDFRPGKSKHFILTFNSRI